MADPAHAQATVFGANGFVGRALVQHLEEQGYPVRAVTRGDASWRDTDLGHAFYTVGLTADFRSRPFETIDAHVSLLTRILRGGAVPVVRLSILDARLRDDARRPTSDGIVRSRRPIRTTSTISQN